MGTKNNPGRFDCYAAAEPDEPTFVLLGRDPRAAPLVVLWAIAYRAMKGGSDPRVQAKFEEAMACAEAMRVWAEERRPGAGSAAANKILEASVAIVECFGALEKRDGPRK